MEERMLKWFVFDHLHGQLKEMSRLYHSLATATCELCPAGPERTVALRKLLEAKDAAVRAVLHPGA